MKIYMPHDSSDLTKYCACMAEIKQRIVLIESFVGGVTLGQESYDYELVSLNLRKILELIAFSSLVANKEIYSKVHKEYLHHWRTGKLIENIEKLNPDFYPKPLQLPSPIGQGPTNFLDSNKPYLKRDEFSRLLNLCSDVLHVWNPYSSRERKIDFELPVLEWIRKIQYLLDIHCVRLVGSAVILIIMHSENGEVRAHYASSDTDQ